MSKATDRRASLMQRFNTYLALGAIDQADRTANQFAREYVDVPPAMQEFLPPVFQVDFLPVTEEIELSGGVKCSVSA